MKLVVQMYASLLVLAIVGACSPRDGNPTTTELSVYDRVLASGTIRASYASYPPYSIRDPNSGELSGIFVEVLEEAGRRLELNVEWVEEVGWGAIFEGLNSNRHDIFGAGIWRNASRGKVGSFSIPIIFNVIKVYGRPDEQRVKDVSDIDNDIKISTLDGAIEDVIAQSDFPASERVSVSQLNPWTDVLLNITSNKADITFAEPAAVNLFLVQNPGTLAPLLPDASIRVFANTYAFKIGESKFKSMLDAVLEEMQNDGTINRIVSKYENEPGEYLRVATPYAL